MTAEVPSPCRDALPGPVPCVGTCYSVVDAHAGTRRGRTVLTVLCASHPPDGCRLPGPRQTPPASHFAALPLPSSGARRCGCRPQHARGRRSRGATVDSRLAAGEGPEAGSAEWYGRATGVPRPPPADQQQQSACGRDASRLHVLHRQEAPCRALRARTDRATPGACCAAGTLSLPHHCASPHFRVGGVHLCARLWHAVRTRFAPMAAAPALVAGSGFGARLG
eukprot:3279066-Prymnesium_polylepis.1